jgi:hypothetical protein
MTKTDAKFQAHAVAAVNADQKTTIRVSAAFAPNRSPSHPEGTSNSVYDHSKAAST